MNQQQGFSLIEVLVSLLLMATVALGLLQHQYQTRQMVTQLILNKGASQFLDEVNEQLYLGADNYPIPPMPYHFRLWPSSDHSNLRIEWLDRVLIRTGLKWGWL